MSVNVFFDINVLVHAAAGRSKDEFKRKRALELVQSENFGTFAQVLQEFYVVVATKIAHPLSAAAALEWIEQWAEFPCQPIDHQLVRIGIELSRRYRISYWDATILAAAESLGASTAYSDDLNHGQQYGAVKVINPFR
ncbi:MAG TPA: PIN domain-containing protein [Bryobacteraceae bacterium]|jgi:predicted nucleic acid-binding protein